MPKQPAPTEAEREERLRDLNQVGPSKPVGYLPLRTIRHFVQRSPKSIAAAATARGLSAALFGPKACCIKSGALYLYDYASLARILETHAEVLETNGLSLDPDQFVAQIARTWLQKDHPAHPVIAEAFGKVI